MASKTTNRRETDIWLVGGRKSHLIGSRLPSKREVLQVYFHLHLSEGKTVRESSSALSDMILDYWNRARIPCKFKKHLILTLEKLVNNWQKLKKNKENKKKRSKTLEDQETIFAASLDALFDIAHPKALELIQVQEDRDFLLAQRETGRRGMMQGVDMNLARKEKRMQERQEAVSNRRDREVERKAAINSATCIVDSSDSDPESTPSDEPAGESDHGATSDVKRARTSVVSPSLAAALDRAKVSDRSATYVLAEAARSLGHEIDSFNINRSSVRRDRMKFRKHMANAIKAEFAPDVPLTIHWDGKLMSDISGKEKVDRLPVLVTGLNIDKLLGVPKLLGGTGENMAASIFSQIEEWDLNENICGECFDTTSSNTGNRNGACVLLEQNLVKVCYILLADITFMRYYWKQR